MYPDSCQRLKFSSPVDGYALEGHVIKNISLSVGMISSCKARCTMERHCVSINTGSSIKDHTLCQLSDSDRILHPEDFRPKEGYTYRGTEVNNFRFSESSSLRFFSLHCCLLVSFFYFFPYCLSVCLFVRKMVGFIGCLFDFDWLLASTPGPNHPSNRSLRCPKFWLF